MSLLHLWPNTPPGKHHKPASYSVGRCGCGCLLFSQAVLSVWLGAVTWPENKLNPLHILDGGDAAKNASPSLAGDVDVTNNASAWFATGVNKQRRCDRYQTETPNSVLAHSAAASYLLALCWSTNLLSVQSWPFMSVMFAAERTRSRIQASKSCFLRWWLVDRP